MVVEGSYVEDHTIAAIFSIVVIALCFRNTEFGVLGDVEEAYELLDPPVSRIAHCCFVGRSGGIYRFLTIAKSQSRTVLSYEAGASIVPSANNADISTSGGTPDVFSNCQENAFEEASDTLWSVANFGKEGLTMLLETKLEDSDRTDPINYTKFYASKSGDRAKAKRRDRFNKLIHETAAAMRAAGTPGDQEPVMHADIPFHRAAKELHPSAGA
ncbi:hypothetical protein B0T25DRAFT_583191 [Lasiosphaeria hispida]|uniref:Uncharacterized protein n=1 Tax=Lasiosphaeria hispida TaxID=260671 RepID=A0AAJ0HB00_9PEZI|nr:hypothetical protein B0T25DRAFT_583191 [Lasiosphaeria hispida]